MPVAAGRDEPARGQPAPARDPGDAARPVYEAATPPSEDVPFVAWRCCTTADVAVAAVGMACIARGLSRARRYEDRAGPWIDWVVPLVPRRRGLRDGRGHDGRADDVGDDDRVDLHRLERSRSACCGWWSGRPTRHRRARGRSRVRRRGPAGGSPRWPPGSSCSRSCSINVVSSGRGPGGWVIDPYQWTVVLAYALGHLLLLVGFHRSGCRHSTRSTMTRTGYDEDNDEGFETRRPTTEDDPAYDDDSPVAVGQARSVGQRRDEVAQEVSPSSTDSIGA